MRILTTACILGVLILAAAASLPGVIQPGAPHMLKVTPAVAKIGDVVTVEGEYLDETRVAGVYLSNAAGDFKASIVEQNTTSIKFKVPEEAHAGKFVLTILSAGPEPQLLEQPVALTVER